MSVEEIRSSKKWRLIIIGVLAVVALFALLTAKTTWAKALAGGALAILLAAFGMEATNHDYDVLKLMDTKSLAASKIERDQKGDLINVDNFCNAAQMNYNCADFKNQTEAMTVYNRCKALGKNMDMFGLDRDHDGKVCEALPAN